jgi:hypothetical protein
MTLYIGVVCLGYVPVAELRKHGNEPMDSINGVEFVG